MPQMVWSTLPDGHHDYYNARWYEFTGVPEGSTDGEGWNGMKLFLDGDASLQQHPGLRIPPARCVAPAERFAFLGNRFTVFAEDFGLDRQPPQLKRLDMLEVGATCVTDPFIEVGKD